MMHVTMLAEAGTGTGSADMSVVVNAIGTVVTVVGKVWDVTVSNPFLLFCVGAAALGIGFGVFRKAKSSAK